MVATIDVLGAFAISFVLVGCLRALFLAFGVLDVPNARSSHVAPTPRGGGAAIAVVTLGAVALSAKFNAMPRGVAMAWIVGGGMVSAAGMIDDIRKVSPLLRLIVQSLAAAGILLWVQGSAPLAASLDGVSLKAVGWLIAGIGIIWYINLFNFMDGIDGLAAMQSLFVAGVGATLIGAQVAAGNWMVPVWTLTGASAGFLVWNFPVAKIFMGDVGSGFIGFSLAIICYWTTSHIRSGIWIWLILNGTFIADGTVTLGLRMFRGQRVYVAHRSHAYQCLGRRWRSHRVVTLVYLVTNLVWCLPWAVAAMRAPERGPMFVIVDLVPLGIIAYIVGAGKSEPGISAGGRG